MKTFAIPGSIFSRRIAGKLSQNFTFNYGLRWELDTPLTDIAQHVQTFRPGQNSTFYPCTNTRSGGLSHWIGGSWR